MELTVREAELSDLAGLVQLSEAFRSTLPGYSPVFWHKRDFLLGNGFEATSEWLVRPL